MIKLNIGSGRKKIKGYINLDAVNYPEVDVVCDVKDLPFEDNSVDVIYSSHVIEHISRHIFKKILKEWYRVLKSEGILYLSTPDFEAVCKRYMFTNDIQEIMGLLVGGQKSELDNHCILFDYKFLKYCLKEIGFIGIKRIGWWKMEPYVLDSEYDDYSSAFLPFMCKENGTLMSLNIVCKKEKKND